VAKPRTKTITLYAADVKRIERLVKSGFCLSSRDAVRKGLDLLEADIEDLLRREVVPVCHEMDAHPERAIPAEEVFNNIRAHYKSLMQKSTEGARPPQP